MKKKLVLLSLAGALGLNALAATSFCGNANSGLNATCTSCSGFHYSGKNWNDASPVSYGKGANGLYEYWHCCNCHNYYFDKTDIPGGYEADKWEEGKVDSKVSASDYQDDRVQFGGTSLIHKTARLDDSSSLVIDGTRDEAYENSSKYAFANSSGTTSATLETLWKDDMLYVYVDVSDETKAMRDLSVSDPDTALNAYDSVELRIDALHSEKLAEDTWNGKEGDLYHKGDEEQSYAAVGRFVVTSGYASGSQYGEGCEFDDSYSLSSACKDDGKTQIKSVYSDDFHYGVEFAIHLGDVATPLNDFGEIGIAVKVNDNSAKGVLADTLYFESINADMDYVRNYSAFRLSGYKTNEEGFDLDSGSSLVKDIKGSSWGWLCNDNKLTVNSSGCYLSSSSYNDFSVLLKFDNISTDSNINPYFEKIARKAFLFGGTFDASGKYQGYALSASKDWFEILQLDGTSSTFVGGYNSSPEGASVRLAVKDGVATLTNADGSAMSNPFAGVSSITLSNYSGGKLGLLRNDDITTTITVAGLSSDASASSNDEASGTALVNEICSDNQTHGGWNFVGNGIAMKSMGHRLSTSSYENFEAVIEINNVCPSDDTNLNPFFSCKAKKAFLFGGSVDANGDYQGYALHFSKDWIEVLKLSGYASTFVDGYNIDGEGIQLRLAVTGTNCLLRYADGTSLGSSHLGQTTIALSDYSGGKIGALRNDGYASSLSIYEFTH